MGARKKSINTTLTLSGLIGTETLGQTVTSTFSDKNVGTAKTVTVNSIVLADGSNGGLASNYSISAGQTTTANINAYGKSGTLISQYVFSGLFPISVDAMDMDWEDSNKIQTFNVTFAYDYWVPVPTITPKGLQGDTPVSTPYNVLTGL